MAIALVLLAAVVAAVSGVNTPPGPVIGILTQDSLKHNPGGSYLAASYVKFIESAGGRVVPVHYEQSPDQLLALFGRLNGLLIPGGSQDLANPNNPFLVAARVFYKAAVDAYAKGDVFPIWGTCQGFQTLAVLANGNASVLTSGFDSENLPLPLQLTSAATGSRLFAGAPAELMKALATANITMNSHHDGVTPSAYDSSPALQSVFTVLSTNVDRQGHPFISTMEGTTLPFFATQWHPEKNAFEWTPDEDIPHSPFAVAACQYTANFFVNQARRSTHTYPYPQLMQDVIWNYAPLFVGKQGSDFTQVYAWSTTDSVVA